MLVSSPDFYRQYESQKQLFATKRRRQNVSLRVPREVTQRWLSREEVEEATQLSKHIHGAVRLVPAFQYDFTRVLTGSDHTQRQFWKYVKADEVLWFFNVIDIAELPEVVPARHYLKRTTCKTFDVLSLASVIELLSKLAAPPEWLTRSATL